MVASPAPAREQIGLPLVMEPMPHVQSAALEYVSYNAAAHALRATFRANGRTYEYEDVPQEIYDALMFADSLGAFFNANIRDRFPFHEV